MAQISVLCPKCGTDHVIKCGKTADNKQRYRCQNTDCSTQTFILDYRYRGCLPEVKKQIVDMAVNGSGIRDTSRVLKISQGTVITTLKDQEAHLDFVNHAALERCVATNTQSDIVVEIHRVDEAEVDEMWSYVRNKDNPRWLWHAIDHVTGEILAYTFGRRKDSVFLALKELLEPFGISTFFTDNFGAYERHIPADQQVVGKINTQKIERKHLTLRTRIKRLARKTICFSKLEKMHDIVIGLFINRYEFGILV
jgi:IS1 family transposase/transposase-like protein